MLLAQAAAAQPVNISGSDLDELVRLAEEALARGGQARFVFVVHPSTYATAFGMGSHLTASGFIGNPDNGYVRGFLELRPAGGWTWRFETGEVLDPQLKSRWNSDDFVQRYLKRLGQNPGSRRVLNTATVGAMEVLINGRPMQSMGALRRSLYRIVSGLALVLLFLNIFGEAGIAYQEEVEHIEQMAAEGKDPSEIRAAIRMFLKTSGRVLLNTVPYARASNDELLKLIEAWLEEETAQERAPTHLDDLIRQRAARLLEAIQNDIAAAQQAAQELAAAADGAEQSVHTFQSAVEQLEQVHNQLVGFQAKITESRGLCEENKRLRRQTESLAKALSTALAAVSRALAETILSAQKPCRIIQAVANRDAPGRLEQVRQAPHAELQKARQAAGGLEDAAADAERLWSTLEPLSKKLENEVVLLANRLAELPEPSRVAEKAREATTQLHDILQAKEQAEQSIQQIQDRAANINQSLQTLRRRTDLLRRVLRERSFELGAKIMGIQEDVNAVTDRLQKFSLQTDYAEDLVRRIPQLAETLQQELSGVCPDLAEPLDEQLIANFERYVRGLKKIRNDVKQELQRAEQCLSSLPLQTPTVIEKRVEAREEWAIYLITNYGGKTAFGKPNFGYLTVARVGYEQNPPLLSSFPGGGRDPRLLSSFPGGGRDPRRLAEPKQTGGTFSSEEAAIRSICGRVTDFFRPPLARFVLMAKYQGGYIGADPIFKKICEPKAKNK